MATRSDAAAIAHTTRRQAIPAVGPRDRNAQLPRPHPLSDRAPISGSGADGRPRRRYFAPTPRCCFPASAERRRVREVAPWPAMPAAGARLARRAASMRHPTPEERSCPSCCSMPPAAEDRPRRCRTSMPAGPPRPCSRVRERQATPCCDCHRAGAARGRSRPCEVRPRGPGTCRSPRAATLTSYACATPRRANPRGHRRGARAPSDRLSGVVHGRVVTPAARVSERRARS
jgi:hypothetical protein